MSYEQEISTVRRSFALAKTRADSTRARIKDLHDPEHIFSDNDLVVQGVRRSSMGMALHVLHFLSPRYDVETDIAALKYGQVAERSRLEEAKEYRQRIQGWRHEEMNISEEEVKWADGIENIHASRVRGLSDVEFFINLSAGGLTADTAIRERDKLPTISADLKSRTAVIQVGGRTQKMGDAYPTRVLLALAQEPGKPISIKALSEILKMASGLEKPPAVSPNIQALRKYLEADPYNPSILLERENPQGGREYILMANVELTEKDGTKKSLKAVPDEVRAAEILERPLPIDRIEALNVLLTTPNVSVDSLVKLLGVAEIANLDREIGLHLTNVLLRYSLDNLYARKQLGMLDAKEQEVWDRTVIVFGLSNDRQIVEHFKTSFFEGEGKLKEVSEEVLTEPELGILGAIAVVNPKMIIIDGQPIDIPIPRRVIEAGQSLLASFPADMNSEEYQAARVKSLNYLINFLKIDDAEAVIEKVGDMNSQAQDLLFNLWDGVDRINFGKLLRVLRGYTPEQVLKERDKVTPYVTFLNLSTLTHEDGQNKGVSQEIPLKSRERAKKKLEQEFTAKKDTDIRQTLRDLKGLLVDKGLKEDVKTTATRHYHGGLSVQDRKNFVREGVAIIVGKSSDNHPVHAPESVLAMIFYKRHRQDFSWNGTLKLGLRELVTEIWYETKSS